ncbi:hypothetical protein [Geminisphaera colitermitum]|uniref:hypothetical protein n=1 Tax=Geminisphaera colitermitum TaxID=1148786 RepID=UPI000158CF5C|nr:hypothetical protein [Geminisphaera colitermitum]
MNTTKPVLVTLLAVATTAAAALAATSVNLLTDNATVRAAGNYTYYARGNGVYSGSDPAPETYTPFTRKFYPGPPHTNETGTDKGDKLRDGTRSDISGITTTAGDKIRFDAGELTNGVTTGDLVGGWWGVTEITKTTWTPEGRFDILFDLGASYVITSIEIVYSDAGSRRWSSTADIQKVYYAETLAGTSPAESDFASLFGNGTITAGTSVGTLAITPTTGTSVVARYLDLRLTTQIANGNTGAYGGYLHEVRIYGYETATPSIPEPSTTTILLGAITLPASFILIQRRFAKK